ncbi:MAG: thioredoxin domain-containing protein, partial [Rudaea sp.]
MSNRLADEASPYLRQHADNPVDWWPWSAAALAAARAQDKPILLSIGYSACHWCHVMAHESFGDAATARLMNDKFICIKVDREERPDLDKIYQLAHQALTQRGGGWPLTMFLAPDDLTPFYAGTYFPKQARYGMPPFAYMLEQVRGLWDQRRGDVHAQNATLREFLDQYGDGASHGGALSDEPIRSALKQIEQNFDRMHGGHLGAPKFAHCAEMELLLEADTQDARAMLELTLTRIAAGGIHDQIGGGFCRYSVDERWEIPHFEKMLYDNAQLLPLYALGARATGNAHYRRAAQELVTWLTREMTTPCAKAESGAAFYAALDADSEGEEGKFYIWRRDEVQSLLSADEFAVAERYYGFDRAPNFEGVYWNPLVAESTAALAAALNLTVADVDNAIGSARAKLFAARSARARPGLDDKILTSWNALMITGLARAARALDTPALA